MPISNPAPPPPKNPRAPKTQPLPVSKLTERAEGLQQWTGIGEAVLIAFRQHADSGALAVYAPGITREVAKLAETDERVAGVIDPIIAAGPLTGIIAATIPLIFQFAVNHGRMRPGAMGTVPKELLSAQVEADIARMQAEALRAQVAAEQETARLQEEIRQSRAVVPSTAVT